MQIADSKEYRDGDVVLVRAKPLLEHWAVYDHAALIWTYDQATYTVEAGFSSIRAWVLGHWQRPYDVFRPDGADATSGVLAAHRAIEQLGEGYAFWKLPAIVRKILRRPGTVTVAQAMVCTELVTWAWAMSGFDFGSWIEYPTPDEIAEALR